MRRNNLAQTFQLIKQFYAIDVTVVNKAVSVTWQQLQILALRSIVISQIIVFTSDQCSSGNDTRSCSPTTSLEVLHAFL